MIDIKIKGEDLKRINIEGSFEDIFKESCMALNLIYTLMSKANADCANFYKTMLELLIKDDELFRDDAVECYSGD